MGVNHQLRKVPGNLPLSSRLLCNNSPSSSPGLPSPCSVFSKPCTCRGSPIYTPHGPLGSSSVLLAGAGTAPAAAESAPGLLQVSAPKIQFKIVKYA